MHNDTAKALRQETCQHIMDPQAKVPCPGCAARPAPAAEAPACLLCDGVRVVTKARALAVLPHVARNAMRLEEALRRYGRHEPGCEADPEKWAHCDTRGGMSWKPRCTCGLWEAQDHADTL